MAIDFITGVLQIANVFLAIVAGVIAASLFQASSQKQLRPWRPLIAVLILFAVEEILGGLRSFNIYANPWITHVVPSFMFGFLIWALIRQINLVRGEN